MMETPYLQGWTSWKWKWVVMESGAVAVNLHEGYDTSLWRILTQLLMHCGGLWEEEDPEDTATKRESGLLVPGGDTPDYGHEVLRY